MQFLKLRCEVSVAKLEVEKLRLSDFLKVIQPISIGI